MDYLQYQQPQSLQTPEQRQMGLLLHLSQLLGPIIPIILWQVQKDKMPAIDAHGKMVVNWTISLIIYTVVTLF